MTDYWTDEMPTELQSVTVQPVSPQVTTPLPSSLNSPLRRVPLLAALLFHDFGAPKEKQQKKTENKLVMTLETRRCKLSFVEVLGAVSMLADSVVGGTRCGRSAKTRGSWPTATIWSTRRR
eukprot:276229-Rhodomonas_salina.2